MTDNYYTLILKHQIHCGHRVYGHEGRCNRLHGHSYLFTLKFIGNTLNELGMVVDFAIIKQLFYGWLDNNWDHRLILWKHDPAVAILATLDSTLVTLDYNPTAENLARYIVELAPILLQQYPLRLVEAIVAESLQSSASYTLVSD